MNALVKIRVRNQSKDTLLSHTDTVAEPWAPGNSVNSLWLDVDRL